MLVKMGEMDGGRVDPDRILARPAESSARAAFLAAQDEGLLDGSGYLTEAGREAVKK